MLGAQGAGVVTQATGVFAIVMALAKVGLDSTAIYLMPRLALDAPEEIRRDPVVYGDDDRGSVHRLRARSRGRGPVDLE